VLFFLALIAGTGSSTVGEAGVAAGAAIGALGVGVLFTLDVSGDGVVAGTAGSAESAIGGGAEVSPAGAGGTLCACDAALMAESLATCRFACTANMEAPTAQRAARPNPTTTLLVMFECVSEYAMMNLSQLVDDVITVILRESTGCRSR
jgi:hypothetical protein